MALQALDFKNTPNQYIETSVEVDGNIIDLELFLRWNSMAGYWTVDIKDRAKGETVIASMPLLARQNCLGQYGYLRIGSMAIGNISSDLTDDEITIDNFGTKFLWVWNDTIL